MLPYLSNCEYIHDRCEIIVWWKGEEHAEPLWCCRRRNYSNDHCCAAVSFIALNSCKILLKFHRDPIGTWWGSFWLYRSHIRSLDLCTSALLCPWPSHDCIEMQKWYLYVVVIGCGCHARISHSLMVIILPSLYVCDVGQPERIKIIDRSIGLGSTVHQGGQVSFD